MQNRNNSLLVLGIALVTFLCTIPLQWVTLSNAQSSLGGFFPGSLVVTGINGSLGFLFKLPIWLLVIFSAIATAISALNLAGFTTIPKLVPVLILAFSGIHYASPIAAVMFSSTSQLSLGAGPFVAILASIVSLVITLSSQQLQPLEADIH